MPNKPNTAREPNDSRTVAPATPRVITAEDASPVSRVLARAFTDDPMIRWFFPDDASRETAVGRYFTTLLTRQYAHHGVCERTDAAAAFWVPPEGREKAVPDAETVRELEEILGDRAALFRAAVEGAGEEAPTEDSWYLAVIGTDPAARGQGHGAALLRSGLAQADAAGLPAHLESSSANNLPFYEHFGFTVTGEARLPGGGPVVWSMRRPPRPANGV
ncbi:GNAT family N-acetyltransferase [Streptomyces sp. AJS327]|uniref:GNAT family N-acetyltransferase n=1 Tax=Streptomyces sp. AJS327 TaxID=2545265 RepID=UPI0015DE97D6|nr:GNAT family N-acetyltransferase [Streptomyces sp. AJS327]MBA0050519.1 GNAT family N-acetyltransferase [Streptomyces sp. AJS327]